MTKQIGIIGVGLMGIGIASNIQRAGWKLHILDHPGNQPTERLVEGGAILYGNSADLARASETIILCVTGATQVKDIVAGPDGVLAGLQPGAAIVDCSTSLPETSLSIAKMVQDAGGVFLDAPMTRTPKEAAEGRLNLMVGGDQSDLSEQLPILESFAENIVHAGGIGAGHSMKLIHNFVSIGFSAVLAEATAISRLQGVESNVFRDILAAGGGAGVVLERMSAFILENDCGDFQFSISNSEKDIGYYRELAARAGGSHTLADSLGQMLSNLVRDGHGAKFVPEIISLLASE